MSEASYDYTGALAVSRLFSRNGNPERILAEIIGPEFTAYRRAWDLARTFKEVPAYPLHVDFEMKFKCPLRCPMCLMSLPAAERRKYGREEEELPPGLVVDFLREGAARGQRSLGFGGLWEPLLCPELPELIEAARAFGLVDAMFNTSGLFLDEPLSKRLIKSGLTRIMISLDAATEETYGRMRPGSDFARVCQNVENFIKIRNDLKSPLPLVRLSFCRTAINEPELPAFLARWENLADFFSIQNYGRYPTLDPPPFSLERTDAAKVPPRPCPQPGKRLLLRHDGRVVPCCDVSGFDLPLGNVYNFAEPSRALGAIWRGKALARIRRAHQNLDFPSACLACQDKFH